MKGSKLYFIKDVLSGVPESGIIQVVNDLVAVKGFLEFCKKDDVKPEQHKLYCIAELDDNNNVEVIYPDGKPRYVCRGDKAEDCFNDLLSQLREED